MQVFKNNFCEIFYKKHGIGYWFCKNKKLIPNKKVVYIYTMRMYIMCLISLFVGIVNGQKTDTTQYYLKIDEKYIESLNQFDSSENNYDVFLKLDTYKQRFDYLNQNTQLSIDYNNITYSYVLKYLNYKWYNKIIGLSVYYFPLFESKLAQYGLPKELKYLSVVESNLNPRAVSHVGAKGLWQFMPETGEFYGLKSNQYVNLFYDPVASSDASARFLKSLYKEFGDWSLAISAYNCGAGNVRKAIRKAGSKNYWKVRPYLPKETQAYVPSFVAVNYLFNFYKYHNIKVNYFKFTFFDTKMIITDSEYSFSDLSKTYNESVLRFCNPQITTDVIPKGSVIYVKQ